MTTNNITLQTFSTNSSTEEKESFLTEDQKTASNTNKTLSRVVNGFWKLYEADEEGEEKEKVKRGPLGKREYSRLGATALYTAGLGLAFDGDPQFKSVLAAAKMDLIKTGFAFTNPSLERWIWRIFGGIGLALGIAKGSIPNRSWTLWPLKILNILPLFEGAAAMFIKYDLVKSKPEKKIKEFAKKVHLKLSPAQIKVAFSLFKATLASLALQFNLGVAPTVIGALIAKGEFRKLVELILKRIGKIENKPQQKKALAGFFVLLTTVALLSITSSQYNLLPKAIQNAGMIISIDTFVRFVKNGMKIAVEPEEEGEEKIVPVQSGLKSAMTKAVKCVAAFGLIGATSVMVGGDLLPKKAEFLSKNSSLIGAFSQDVISTTKIGMKVVMPERVLIGTLLAMVTLMTLTVRLISVFYPDSGLPSKTIAAAEFLLMGILFYFIKRAIRPDKIKVPKAAKVKKEKKVLPESENTEVKLKKVKPEKIKGEPKNNEVSITVSEEAIK